MTLCLPFLMFQGRAQEAIDHYLETFPEAELLEIHHHPEGTTIFDPAAEQDSAATESEETEEEETASETAEESTADTEAEGRPLVATAQIKVGEQLLMLQDSLVKQHFTFTPSVSLAVVVDSSSEFHSIVDKLSEGGQFLMEPGDYEFAKNFAWVQDRFGLSWQVNQPLTAPDENIAQAKAPEWG